MLIHYSTGLKIYTVFESKLIKFCLDFTFLFANSCRKFYFASVLCALRPPARVDKLNNEPLISSTDEFNRDFLSNKLIYL